MPDITLASPSPADGSEFLAAVARSRALHEPWVTPPSTPNDFQAFLAKPNDDRHRSFLIRRRDTGALAGVVNFSEIVRGAFCSAYLGYYAFVPHQRQGFMRQGLRLAIEHAFDVLALHRVEANIQPENLASIALVRGLGFHREGFSPRYLKIKGQWRDHERWALTAEDLAR
jgi:ribosomal-protein-alanine N-acetyltransferase